MTADPPAIEGLNWMQVEAFLQRDNRCVLPLGSTEQHAYLSLCVDNILPERLAREAAAPLGIPVFPVLPYGLTHSFRAFPGTLTLRTTTYLEVVRDLLDGLYEQGFRRIMVINGHGGNTPAHALSSEWMADHPNAQVKFHNWWSTARVWAQVQATDPNANHASWMENFPWTRLPGVRLPDAEKPPMDQARLRLLSPQALRESLGDGCFAGRYQRPDAEMFAIWQVALDETRELLEGGWPDA